MSALWSQIIDKYQGVASGRVLRAVENAAEKTGADFAFLMEKASTESGFNPAAKAKSSSATGLFQFIDSTWLKMVKEHGAKYGLGALADKIDIKDGKPCVNDCDVRNAILNLRKNPEIAALMAGEFSAGNKEYLEKHTDGGVGKTELYLAHFMGASGATKFLNSRDANGDVAAVKLFPKEARANKNVFFDVASGQPRTLNDIYDFFTRKFSPETTPSPQVAAAPPASAPSPVSSVMASMQEMMMQDFHWNNSEDDEVKSGFSHSGAPFMPKLSSANLMLMMQAQQKHS